MPCFLASQAVGAGEALKKHLAGIGDSEDKETPAEDMGNIVLVNILSRCHRLDKLGFGVGHDSDGTETKATLDIVNVTSVIHGNSKDKTKETSINKNVIDNWDRLDNILTDSVTVDTTLKSLLDGILDVVVHHERTGNNGNNRGETHNETAATGTHVVDITASSGETEDKIAKGKAVGSIATRDAVVSDHKVRSGDNKRGTDKGVKCERSIKAIH